MARTTLPASHTGAEKDLPPFAVHTSAGRLQRLIVQLRPVRNWPVWLQYGVSSLFVLVFLALRLLLQAIFIFPYLFFLPAVLLAALFFGRGPAFWASGFSALCAFYFLLDPIHTWQVSQISNLYATLIFLLFSFGISILADALVTTVDKLDDTNETLLTVQQELLSTNNNLERLVTEKVQRISAMEARLVQAQKMEVIGKAVASLAHDFKNILNPVEGAVALLEDQLSGDEAGDEILNLLRQVYTSGSAMIKSTLDFAHTGELSLQSVDVNHLIREHAEAFRHVTGGVIRLHYTLNAALPAALTDPVMLHRSLLNLLANARDAMPGGGAIFIETAPAKLEPVEAIEAGHPDGYVCVSVRDTGTGMSPEVKGKVLEPFFTTKSKGTGLGLPSIAYFIYENKGRIVIESEVGHGTTVRLYLPGVSG